MKYLSILFLCFTLTTLAQVPKPGDPQTKPVALVGGMVHVGDGTVIETGVVTFADGKIQAVGNLETIRINRAEYDIVDTTGKHVYPGFIISDVSLGLQEVSSVRAMTDSSEEGEYNPNVRAIVAYNTDSEFIPTLRFNGILMALTAPGGGVIPGQSSVVQLDAWNWQDAAYATDIGVHLNWPQRKSRRWNFAAGRVETQDNNEYPRIVADLDKMFHDTKAYTAMAKPPARNLKLEAMQGLFDGSKMLVLQANQAKAMIEGVNFAKNHGVKRIIISGGREAYLIADFLKQHDVAVILGGVHRLPDHSHTDVDHPYKLPAMLHEMGVKFCLTNPSLMATRNLPFLAGTAAAYGLDKEIAVHLITGAVADILGIGDTVGTLATGKDATLFISTGDALDMRTNNVEHAFVQGRKLNLPGMQQRLYERYKEKYK